MHGDHLFRLLRHTSQRGGGRRGSIKYIMNYSDLYEMAAMSPISAINMLDVLGRATSESIDDDELPSIGSDDDVNETDIPWADVYEKHEPVPLSMVLYQHDGYPYAILDVTPEIAESFGNLTLYLNGMYTVREIVEAIKARAQSGIIKHS